MGATIKTEVKYGSYFWVKWEVQKQDTAANKSTIAWSCGLYPGEQYYTNAIRMSAVSIDGRTVYAGGTYSDITDYKDHTFASGTLEVSHGGDGSKTLAVGAFSGWLYGNGDYNASAQSFALPTIPRATTPGIGSVTLGETVHISLPRASGGFTHALSYTFGKASGTIATGVGTGYDWSVPESLAAQIPNASGGTGTLTCKTYSGSTLIGTKSVSFTAVVPGSMKPAVADGWAAVGYDNSGTAAGNIAAWVQGYSKAKATFDRSKITCRQGASVSKFSITYLGKTVAESPYRTETIPTTAATVRCTVTDSRGLAAWEDFTITLLEYAPPTLVGAKLFRSDAEGAAADSGTHIAGVAATKYSALGGLNGVTLKGYWKPVGGGYGAGETLSAGTVGLVTGEVEISTDRSYVALLVLTDSLGNAARYEENIPTEKVAFHLKEGGKGAAFGKAAETDRVLELAEDWDLKTKGKLLMDRVYPVGSIYLSVSPASPETLFGGTWERLEDVFLLAAGTKYPAGSTGGEAAHTLTVGELPSHKPKWKYSKGSQSVTVDQINQPGTAYPNVLGITMQLGGNYGSQGMAEFQNIGEDKPHNNMPPYLAVYTWKRIA